MGYRFKSDSKHQKIEKKMASQLKAKPCKKFGAFLWNHRKMTEKQQKVVQLQSKKLKTKKLSNFAVKFRAKQLVTALYGQIRFKQLKQLTKLSEKYPGKVTHVLFSLLEKRLDSFLVHLGFTPTFASAKQLINHNKVYVNKKLVTSPAFCLKPGDVISFANETKDLVARNIQVLVNQQKQQKFLFYKKLHAEVNYKTLEAVLLFSPQQIHYAVQVDPELVLKALR